MREEIKGLFPQNKATIGDLIDTGSTVAFGQQRAKSTLLGLSANSVLSAFRSNNFTSTDTTSGTQPDSLEELQAYVQNTNHTIFLFDALGDPVVSVDKDGVYLTGLDRGTWLSATGKTSQVSVNKGAELYRMAKIAKANANAAAKAGVTSGVQLGSFALRPKDGTNLNPNIRDLFGAKKSTSTIAFVASTEIFDQTGVLMGTVSAISSTADW